MSDINTISMSGRLTRDADVMNYSGGQYVKFGLATGKWNSAKQEETPIFTDVTTFSKYAVKMAEELTKGTEVFITGELDYLPKDDQNGRPAKHSILAREVKLGRPPRGNQSRPAAQQSSLPYEDEDVPF